MYTKAKRMHLLSIMTMGRAQVNRDMHTMAEPGMEGNKADKQTMADIDHKHIPARAQGVYLCSHHSLVSKKKIWGNSGIPANCMAMKP
jgi:hypothetical protein